MLAINMNIKEINEFKEWLRQHGIDEKNNFAKSLIEFVKVELKKREDDNAEKERSEIIITVDEEFKEEVTEFKELIDYLWQNTEEGEIFKLIEYEKNEKDERIKRIKSQQ